MLYAFRACAGAFALVIAAMAPAAGQFPPGPDDQTGQPGAAPQGRKSPPPAAGPSINGSWSGELTQVGSQTPYRFELAINAGKAETRYPDLDCRRVEILHFFCRGHHQGAGRQGWPLSRRNHHGGTTRRRARSRVVWERAGKYHRGLRDIEKEMIADPEQG